MGTILAPALSRGADSEEKSYSVGINEFAATQYWTAEATFSNTGRHIVVRGGVTTSIELECARCLEQFQVKVASPVEEELELLVPLVESEADEAEEPFVKELEGLFVDNVLDITELLRQNILLAVPIKPICSDTCKGLCPHCGKNLNQGPCECPQGESDSALAKLGSLLKEEEK